MTRMVQLREGSSKTAASTLENTASRPDSASIRQFQGAMNAKRGFGARSPAKKRENWLAVRRIEKVALGEGTDCSSIGTKRPRVNHRQSQE
jgi:hypothetical protein